MTNRLDEIRARVKSATDGPWGFSPKAGDAVIAPRPDIVPNAGGASRIARECSFYGGEVIAESMGSADREFIAHSKADVEFLLDELILARKVAEEACTRHNELLAVVNTVTCAFCGAEYPKGTPRAGSGQLADHIGVCEKHPMRALAEATTKLRLAAAEYHRLIAAYLESTAKLARRERFDTAAEFALEESRSFRLNHEAGVAGNVLSALLAETSS